MLPACPETSGRLPSSALPEDYDRDDGARVTTSNANSPFTYREKPRPSGRGINRTLRTDNEALFDWLRHTHDQDLLSDDDLARLLDYMEFRLDIVVDEAVRPGSELELQTTSGDKYGIPWNSVEEMERILWRTGLIDDKAYVPRWVYLFALGTRIADRLPVPDQELGEDSDSEFW